MLQMRKTRTRETRLFGKQVALTRTQRKEQKPKLRKTQKTPQKTLQERQIRIQKFQKWLAKQVEIEKWLAISQHFEINFQIKGEV